jgi:hypothetical protein
MFDRRLPWLSTTLQLDIEAVREKRSELSKMALTPDECGFVMSST